MQRTARPVTLALVVELLSDAPRIGIQLDDRVQIESLVDQLDPTQIDFEQLLRAQATRCHERLQLRDARAGDVTMIAAERAEVLRGCVAGLCVRRQRCQGSAARSQRAGL